MEETKMVIINQGDGAEAEAEAEAEAHVGMWKYALGFVQTAVIKCAIDLGIAEAIGGHGGPMTLADLSAALDCAPSTLHRIMRFLVHHQVFKSENKPTSDATTLAYALTPLSRRMIKCGSDSMAALVLFESTSVMLAPWLALSSHIAAKGKPTFESVHGQDLWSFASANPNHNKLLNDAMACDTRVVAAKIIKGSPEVFDGVGSVVDVGGGDGTLLNTIVEAFPWIHGINFDLPHVVSLAPVRDRVEHVGGDMFHGIPKADVACLSKVLHDWSDEECIEILKKCREAIAEKKGKVIIIESVIDEEEHGEVSNLKLMLDMVMMVHTNNGKERTFKEWSYVLAEAGFWRFAVKPNVRIVQYSIIEVFP